MSLLDQIGYFLANQNSHLQVSSRQRVATSSGATAIPANGTATVLAQVVLPGVFRAGDAFWMEAILGSVSVAAKGLTITDVNLVWRDSAPNDISTYGQPTLTTLAPQATTSTTFAPSPQLVQFEDLDSIDFQENGVHAGVPLRLALRVTLTNSTAGAINATVFLNVIYRIVQGLQEG